MYTRFTSRPDRKDNVLLYVVATPLGHSEDITLRALEVLESCDEWVVEDTRRAAKLRDLHELPDRPFNSYYDEVESARAGGLIGKLERGLDLALISDSGTPQVEDPGYNLVKEAHAAGLEVRPVPGPSAPAAALSVSGFPSDRFLSLGFLAKKQKQRRDSLLEVQYFSGTVIFFESPRRVIASLRLLANLYGNREVFVAREMTKKFEQYLRGPVKEVIDELDVDSGEPRGEFTVLVHPGQGEDVEPEEYLRELLEKGLKMSDAARIAAKFSTRTRSELYKIGLDVQAED